MGLDLVEIFLAVEEEFGLAIPDEAAAELRRPRTLIDYVLQRIPHAVEAPCPSLRGFHLLRSALLLRTGCDRADVRLETKLAELCSKGELLNQLASLRTELQPRMWPGPRWHLRARAVRDLVRFAATSERVRWSRRHVARRVRGVVIHQLGLRPDEYREDADFVRELGAG